MTNKYGAVKVKKHGYTFDSKFECTVYELLTCYFVPCQISVHHPIEFAPKTDRFPAWVWKADFYIGEKNLIIEAKGVQTPEWKLKIRAIDALSPKILSRVIVVSEKDDEAICKGLRTVSIPKLAAYLERFRA